MIEQLVHDTILGAVAALGFDIVRIRMLDKNVTADSATKVLEILIERKDGVYVSIADCKNVSNAISTILDVEEVIDSKYNLEVSSAGVERPLIKPEDFVRFNNYVVQIKLHQAVEGAKKYIGRIISADAVSVTIKQDNGTKELSINFENIKDAKLVLTDELFRKIIK